MSEALEITGGGTEAAYRVLADCMADFVCLATTHGEIFYLNPAGRQMVGLGEDEPLASLSLHDFYPEDSWKELRDVGVPAVNRAGHWEGRSCIRDLKTGDLATVRTLMRRVRLPQADRPTALAIIHRGVEEVSRLRAALVEAQARKNSILESSVDPIITVNHEGVIIEFNRAAEQAFGYAREKVLGTRPSDVLFPPSMSAEHRKRIERYLEAGEGSMLGRRAEVAVNRANGEVFPAELAMVLSQERGSPVMTLYVRDISLRKKTEEEQARHAAELERSNSELEQFAYVASHDLQEPLRKIRTFGDRLQVKCQDLLDETARDCVDRMRKAAARMQELIEGLLMFSRITTRARDFVPVNLAEVAREVVSDLEAQIERVGGRVEVGGLPKIQAEPLQIRQLFQNLIANALKFRRPDEPPVVKIEGRFVQGRKRRPGASATEEQCRITVEDNGIGFDDQYRDHIFGLFQRLHPRDEYEGTGIGLALCRKIVECHGGTISARSAPGHGSIFEVLLPVRQSGKKRERHV
ncbi:MAG: PAS domain S-box protein [Thermoguttaceae bacterium]|jgi:two-component system sensor kinase FixL